MDTSKKLMIMCKNSRFPIIFFLLLLVSCTIPSFAANKSKEYKKILENLDVADSAKAIISDPVNFWKIAIAEDVSLNTFLRDIKKGRGAEKEAIAKTAEIPRFKTTNNDDIVLSLQGFCDTLLIDMGITDLDVSCSLHVVYSPEINAYSTLSDSGFAMLITTALFFKEGITRNMLKGFVAHEFAHGVLLHQIRRFYAEAKKRRKNELLGGIAMGLNVVAAGFDGYNAGLTGSASNSAYYTSIINQIAKDVKIETTKYRFKYSREQEYEADLFAYRFMKSIGCANDFSDGLKLLGTDYDNLYNDYKDHPTINSRIDLLSFAGKNPAIGNKNCKKRP